MALVTSSGGQVCLPSRPATSGDSTVHRRLTNFSLVLVSTVLCLLSVEVALRVIGYNPFGDLLNGREFILRESGNQVMRYELTPNSEGYAWHAEVKINSYGFRDREYDIEKPDGTYRIIAIGDSITFGNSLSANVTFPERLEDFFRSHNLAVEVLNLGVGGYDTMQEIAFLQELGLQFHPDEVIVGYCMNDVGVVSANLKYIRRARSYGKPVYNFRILQFVRIKIDILSAKFYSGVLNGNDNGDTGEKEKRAEILGDAYVSERMRLIEEYVSSNADYPTTFSWYASAHRLSNLRAGFERLKVLSRQHGFKVSVVIIPFVREHVDAYGAAYDIVRNEARRNGFQVIEPLQKFVDTGITRLKISPRDGIHPNELGHRLIAEKLFEFYLQGPNKRILLNRTAY